jgi:hypothetical protein
MESLDIEFLQTVSALTFSSELEEAAILSFFDAILSLSGKLRPKSDIFQNHCADFVVLTDRSLSNLRFSALIPRIVDVLSFKTVPSVLQHAVVESTSIDLLFCANIGIISHGKLGAIGIC